MGDWASLRKGDQLYFLVLVERDLLGFIIIIFLCQTTTLKASSCHTVYFQTED